MLEPLFRKNKKLREAYQWTLRKLFPFELMYKYGEYYDEISVMKEEWDYLLVLDACRYDYFEKFNNLNGDLCKRISLGSDTQEWIEKNFRFPRNDTVYVSANPKISKFKLKKWLGSIPFFSIEEVWDYGWDSELSTVPPENVVESALRVVERYPDKRMIVHFIQPHQPFILNLNGGILLKDRIFNLSNHKDKERFKHHVFEPAMRGELEN